METGAACLNVFVPLFVVVPRWVSLAVSGSG